MVSQKLQAARSDLMEYKLLKMRVRYPVKE